MSASSVPTAAPAAAPTPAEQAEAARGSVLVLALADRSAILVSGGDRVSWLNGLVTCDLAKLRPGEAAYGLLVEKKGRIQTDLYAVPAAAGDADGNAVLALAVPASLRDDLVPALDHYLIMEDVELEKGDVVFHFAHGPRAAELAAAVSGACAFAGKLDLLGHGGVVLGVQASEAAALSARLAAEAGKLGGVVGDEAGLEALRIERGLPRFGVEVDATLYPQEASLEKLAVSFSKGCYLGQEVVYMLENRGHVKRKLVPLDVDGEALPEKGAAVSTPAGEAIGEIRSAARGPLTHKTVAIAMVKWAHAKPETELRIGDRAARVRAFP